MPDITKIIQSPDLGEHDPEGHMLDLEPWSVDIAHELAKQDGLKLNDDHFQVLFYLRDRYREKGRAASAREIVKELEEGFKAEGGRKCLYELFPMGPVAQGSRIAGVPAPPFAADPSFGSVE